MNEAFNAHQGQTLLLLARSTLIHELGGDASRIPPDLEQRLQDPVFDQKRGTFVTLHMHGNLRGCIGSLVGTEPLRDNVVSNARNAAFQDPRFPPLRAHELPKVDIEISVLTPPQPLEYWSPQDLIDKLKPHVHGVIVKHGMAQSTFLPQVWDQLPDVQSFLEHLCQKAGLAATAWQSGQLQVMTYEVQSFADKEEA